MAHNTSDSEYVVALLPLSDAAATLDRLGADGFQPAQIAPLHGNDLLGTLTQQAASAGQSTAATGHAPDAVMVVVLHAAEPAHRRRAEDLLVANGADILGTRGA